MKRLDAHVMWLVAPESITQDLFVYACTCFIPWEVAWKLELVEDPSVEEEPSESLSLELYFSRA